MSAATLQTPDVVPADALPTRVILGELEREHLLVFDPHGLLREVVRASMAGLACDVTAVGTMLELGAAAREHRPMAALLGGDVPRAAALLRSQPGCEEVPFAALSETPTLTDAASAIHAGACLCLSAPIAVDSVRAAIETLRQTGHEENPRVLVVDDPAAASELTGVLRDNGMAASSLRDARSLLQRLEAFKPDALVMDVELPGLSGIEVCRALRALPRWRSLPVLLLSGYANEETRLKAFEAGADDFLQWPVPSDELTSLLRARIERARYLLERSDRDSLTGLLTRRAFLEALQGRLADASRHGRHLTVGLLDLDLFKQVNDRHGHLVGDKVLAGVGRHLAQRLRLEDLRGRWGGEELVVALPGEDIVSAHRVVDRLRSEFSALAFTTDAGDPFTTSFSAGLACLPADGSSVEQLLHAADERLYRAKRAGWNRVVST